MKKFQLSRVVPLTLSIVLSSALSLSVGDAIAAQGIKAVAALKGSRPVEQPWLVRSHRAPVADAARRVVC